MKFHLALLSASLGVCIFAGTASVQGQALGIFEGSQDVGNTVKPGTASYDAAQKSYTVSGGGANMWFTNDAFQFVWKKVSGDVSVAANIQWLGEGVNPHRKACVIIRQDLEPGSAYADVAVHGDGLTSLQYREAAAGMTHEIQSSVKGPSRVRIQKEGNYVWMSIAQDGESLHSAGGSFRIKFAEPFYVGIGVCSHDSNVIEKAVFSNVEITPIQSKTNTATVVESTLETIAIGSTDRRVVYSTNGHFEAPNWSRDGKYLLFNSGGRIYTLPVTGGVPKLVDTGFATRCNNDHGISPDGKELVISDQTKDGKSRIYTLPIDGGIPRLITPSAPSYWHGWSPDGTLAFCGERNGEFDVYTIPATGGEEKRLTTAKGLDDGPEYSPDGQYIYFNSDRTGLMQIWRMKPDGTDQLQVTSDDYNNWFAHPSPDGKWIVFLSYEKEVTGHPANKDVMLRLMPTRGGEIKVLAKLFGGQGTMNVPSWSPNSANVAFVSYRLISK